MPELDDINQQLDAALKDAGVPLNDTDTDPAAPPAQQRDEIAELRGQIQTLQSLIENASRGRYVGAEGDRPAPQPQAQPNSLKPWEYTGDQFALDAARDTPSAIMDGLNAKLGLPKGSNPFGLFEVVARQLNELKTRNEGLESKFEEERLQRSVERFFDTHPDYEPNDKNSKILMGYMERYGLPPTEQGYDLAYAKAVEEKAFGASHGRQNTQDDDQTEQRQAPARVPSVRSRPSAKTEQSVDDLITKFDKLPTKDAWELYEKMVNGIS